ncbi:MAG: NAD-dependent deacylase [Verrucomicrobiota bacterium]
MSMSEPSAVVLTGAGISVESGLPTFRDKDGLWEGQRVEDVACPEAFARDPERVQRFYNLRRAALNTVEPNAAHQALARLQQAWPGRVTLITQNVDDLHERAGSTEVIHMHGELRKALCTHCENRMEWLDDLHGSTLCPACGRRRGLRPDIVWFGEIPYHMERIDEAVVAAGIFAAIGTSGPVYPAAGLAHLAKSAGARTLEINNTLTQVSGCFDRHLIGPATVQVPRWVEELIG